MAVVLLLAITAYVLCRPPDSLNRIRRLGTEEVVYYLAGSDPLRDHNVIIRKIPLEQVIKELKKENPPENGWQWMGSDADFVARKGRVIILVTDVYVDSKRQGVVTVTQTVRLTWFQLQWARLFERDEINTAGL